MAYDYMILYDVYGKVKSTLLKIVISLFIFQVALGVTMQGRLYGRIAALESRSQNC